MSFFRGKYFTFLWSVRHSNLFVEKNERVLSQERVYLWISISLHLKSLQSLPGPVICQSLLLASQSTFEMVAKMTHNRGICLLKAELIGALLRTHFASVDSSVCSLNLACLNIKGAIKRPTLQCNAQCRKMWALRSAAITGGLKDNIRDLD